MNLTDIDDGIDNYLSTHVPEIAETICRLVSIPSMTGDEAAAQRFMHELYSSLNLEVISLEADIERLRKHSAFVPSNWSYEGRPNIVGILHGATSARSLILNGHIDVVSPEPVGEWSVPPWEGRVIGNKVYGRGACDTKGGLVASFYALKCLIELGLRLQGTVILQSVIEEEPLAGGGTLACLAQGITADGMIVVEPNQEVVLTLAHTGILFFRVRVLGRPAHAGLSHLGVNAIGKLNRIYDELMDLDQARATRVHDPIFERDHPRSCHLNIGTYRAGDSSTTVAGWAEIECRMSYIPDEDPEGVKSQVEQAIDRVVQHDDWLASHPPEITWMKRGAIAWKQDPQHPFAEMLKSVMGQVMGTKVEVVGVPWGMDSRFAGLFNIAAATIGPTGRNFHGIDEYVELDSVVNCAKVLAMFTSRWCGTYDDQRGSLRT